MKQLLLSFVFSLFAIVATGQKHGAIQLQNFGFAEINFDEAQFFAGDQFLGNADKSGFFQPKMAVKKKMTIIHPMCDTLLMEEKLSEGDYLFVRLHSKKGLDSTAKAAYLENYTPQCGDYAIEKNCDSLAAFTGGMQKMKKFLADNIRYPQSAVEQGISGKVYLTFIVDESGNVSCVELAKSSGHDEIDKEAIRVVKKFPKFTPALKNGVAVKSVYFMPVSFQLF